MTKPFSIIFCGTPDFAVPSLQALIDDSAFDVTLVVTQPDRPVGRKQILTSPPIKTLAEAHAIPVIQPENINEEIDALKKYPCDFLVVVAYGQLLSQPVLDLPTIAPVNVHASLLPRWRGASPIQHAILTGDAETGVTVQRIVQKLDAGPILSQTSYTLDARETTPSLYEALANTGAALLVHTLKVPTKETEPEGEVTTCKKLSREDGNVDTQTMTAEEIDRKVRALVPWPGVTCTVTGKQIKLLETSLEPVPESMQIPCAKNTTLSLVTVQAAGGKPMNGAAWERGL